MPGREEGRKTGGKKTERTRSKARRRVLCVFGTRPEVIKLAPVLRELSHPASELEPLIIASGQHTSLLYPFLDLFNIKLDHDLQVMRVNQTPNEVCSRVMTGLDPIVRREKPDAILVQGDTTTALAGALTGFHHNIPVGHVEAGLRSGDLMSPFPEEMNRQLISRLASYHFAATIGNKLALLQEGVSEEKVFVTGNPVVDSLQYILQNSGISPRLADILNRVGSRRVLVLTTHRRESFGDVMRKHLRDLRKFVAAHEDLALVFAVHPNPNVVAAAQEELRGCERIHLVEPLCYPDFIHLLQHAWLLVSDSGGVQEEAPTLGKPLLVLRENTERPEAVECGVAMLVGNQPERLPFLLETTYRDESWARRAAHVQNPFGNGTAGKQIAGLLHRQLCPVTKAKAEIA